jgi:hypothetical protein
MSSASDANWPCMYPSCEICWKTGYSHTKAWLTLLLPSLTQIYQWVNHGWVPWPFPSICHDYENEIYLLGTISVRYRSYILFPDRLLEEPLSLAQASTCQRTCRSLPAWSHQLSEHKGIHSQVGWNPQRFWNWLLLQDLTHLTMDSEIPKIHHTPPSEDAFKRLYSTNQAPT